MKTLLQGGLIYQHSYFQQSDVALQDGIVTNISPLISPSSFPVVLDISNCIIIPGFADVHVHFREPGFSYKETIESGSCAAARGGYTSVCAMPNLDPVPDSPEHLQIQQELIAKKAVIPVYPYASVTVGEAGRELADFDVLAPMAVAFSDDGKGIQDLGMMEEAMRRIARTGKILAAHCEDNSLLQGGYIHKGKYAREHGHAGICSESEWRPIERDLELVRRTGCAYHICHISAKESVELLRRGKKEGLPVSGETAPHYLLLSDEDLQEDGRFKMNPPLRSPEDRDALIEGLLDGTISMIATDHAPHSGEEKSRGLKHSAMGISGLECAFSVLYTGLVKTGILPLEKLIELMSINPRKRFSLKGGTIQIGEAADFSVWDLTKQYNIEPDHFLSKGHSTPFAQKTVYGENRMTYADGRLVWQKNETEN